MFLKINFKLALNDSKDNLNVKGKCACTIKNPMNQYQ